MKKTKRNIRLAKKYASSRAGASGPHNLGPDFEEAIKRGPRYLPTLGGKGVRNTGDPEFGFKEKADATKAAQQFKQTCKDALMGIA